MDETLQQDPETPLQKKLREIREGRASSGLGGSTLSASESPPTSPTSSIQEKLAQIRASKVSTPTNEPVDKSGGATAGAVEGVKDFVHNLGGVAEGAIHAVTHPSEIGGMIGEGAGAIGGMIQHPLITAKNILWDGLVKPLVANPLELAFDESLTPEQRFDKAKESTSIAAGLAVGDGVGRALNMLGRGANTALALRELTGAKTAEEVVNHLASMTDAKTALLARDLAMQAHNGSAIKSAIRVGAVGFGSGFGMGSAMSNDPNEAFKQGVVTGMAGVFLGGASHLVKAKTPYNKFAQLALDKAKELMLPDVMKAAPEHALADLYEGMDFVNLAAKHLPEGESHALYNVPNESIKKYPDNVHVRDNGDGTSSVLIVGVPKPEMVKVPDFDKYPNALKVDQVPPAILKSIIWTEVKNRMADENAHPDAIGHALNHVLGPHKTVHDLFQVASDYGLHKDELFALSKGAGFKGLISNDGPGTYQYESFDPGSHAEILALKEITKEEFNNPPAKYYTWDSAPPTAIKLALLKKIQDSGSANAHLAKDDLSPAVTIDDLIKSAKMHLGEFDINKAVMEHGLKLDSFSYDDFEGIQAGAGHKVRYELVPLSSVEKASIVPKNGVITWPIGTKLTETIFNPGLLDGNGDPAVIALHNELITPAMILKFKQAGIEKFQTNKGLVDLRDVPFDPKAGNKIIIDASRAQYWKDNGFVHSQAVMYKGAEHQFVSIEGKKAKLINMASGKEVLAKLSDVSVQSGRVTQVEYKAIVDTHNQTPQSLSEAYGNARLWLKNLFDEYKNSAADEPYKYKHGEAPPIPLVRWQAEQLGEQITYSKVRKNTYYSFADSYGQNFEYQKAWQALDSYHEGGNKPFYVLAPIGKKPLFLMGQEAYPGHTGKAILGKLKPEWNPANFTQGGKTYNEIVDWLTQKLTEQHDEAALDWLKQGLANHNFQSWDRLGSEVAKDQGFTDVINVLDPAHPEYSGNEYVKLEPPEAYKEMQITKRNHLPLDVTYYDEAIKTQKFYDTMVEDSESATIYLKNLAALEVSDLELGKQTVNAMANSGHTFEPTNDGKLWIVDKNGKRVYLADDLNAAYEYSKKLPDTSGIDLIPTPPDRGVSGVAFDDNASFALNAKRNAINGLRDWFNKRFAFAVPAYNYFMTLESTVGKRFFNDFFLPLQKAKAIYNAAMLPMVDNVNKALIHLQPLDADRRAKVGVALTTASVEEIMGDNPTVLSRALTDAEKRLGQELAKFSTNEDRAYAYKYLRAEKHLHEALSEAAVADQDLIKEDFARKFQPTDVQAQVIKTFRDITGEDIDKVSLNGVNELADAINNPSLTQEDYMQKHNFTKGERQAVKDIEAFYKTIAPIFGIAPHSRIARYLTRVSQFDGNVPDGSIILNDRFINAKDRSFIYALVRSGENRNLLTDPAAILQRYVTHGVKDRYLYPALKEAKDFLKNAYEGMDSRAATEIHSHAAQYMSEIVGSRNPNDALVMLKDIEAPSGAFIKTIQMLGVQEGTGTKWLRNYFKISELATQGFKPVAGLRDATTTMMYYYARFGAKGIANLMMEWNRAIESGDLLKAKGVIPGLSIEFFNALDEISNRTLLDKAANTGFKYSGQPFVYQQFHAMAYLERAKTVSSAVTDFYAQKITQKQFERRIGLNTYDKPVIQEFYRKMNSGTNGPLEATKYIADITGREMVGIYGMANHPFFMGSKIGKLFGQHGQWPLWMLQNFGRLASQGTRGQRLLTAAKVAGMAAAVNLGGRAAGFNLGSWSFDPSNAVYLPYFSAPAGQGAFWASVYFGTNDPSQREFAGRMLERYTNLERSQFYLPIPSQAYNIMWGMARSNANDPPQIIGGQILGIPINQKEFPKPDLTFGGGDGF